MDILQHRQEICRFAHLATLSVMYTNLTISRKYPSWMYDHPSQTSPDNFSSSLSIPISDKKSKANKTGNIVDSSQIRDYFMEAPCTSFKKAGEDLGFSPSVISGMVKELVAEGVLPITILTNRRGRKPKIEASPSFGILSYV